VVRTAQHQGSQHHSAFGSDLFGRAAERFARFLGSPAYIISQTAVVIVWILGNSYFLIFNFDPKPWIMLNLVFSTQAAYAAPLILLAQTRQAARDKHLSEQAEMHREQLADAQQEILDLNTALTKAIHAKVVGDGPA